MADKNITFRASAIGSLMVGGNRITDKQLAELDALQLRKEQAASETLIDGKLVKPLTYNMEKKLTELIAKRDAPFEFGESSKRFIEKEWLRKEYGYDEPLVTKEMLKGHLCEQDSIGLVAKLYPSKQFRAKNKKRQRNDWFSGHCDIDLDSEDIIEDVKTSWDIRTFFETRSFPELYYAQGQVYMDLYGRSKFRLHYCLVDTPEELILEEEKRFWFKFGCDDQNPNYIECSEKIRRNHKVDGVVPIEQRIKTFEFERDEEYLTELKKRVELARIYYQSLTLISNVKE